jgi:hypothetical protein
MEPVIAHIQITLRDLSVAEPFYDRLMALLGGGGATARHAGRIPSRQRNASAVERLASGRTE